MKNARSRLVLCAVVGLICCRGLAASPTTAPTTRAGKDLRIGSLRVGKVLFLGNSITLHGPAAQIGWLGNWGMAASAVEKDYVHLLIGRITEAAGGKPEARIGNIADFERKHATFDLEAGLKDDLAFEADVVIVAIGENVPALGTPEAKTAYADAFAKLLATLKTHGRPVLIVRSCFWADGAKDEIMRKACADAGGVFVDIGKLGADPENFARTERKIEHAGVGAHPGDAGMQAIADAIWAAIQGRAKE